MLKSQKVNTIKELFKMIKFFNMQDYSWDQGEFCAVNSFIPLTSDCFNCFLPRDAADWDAGSPEN